MPTRTSEAHEDHCDWEYDPGRCTFCGRCVRYYPGEAEAAVNHFSGQAMASLV